MREITDALSHTDTIGYLFSSSGLLPLEKERFRIYRPEDGVRFKCVIEPTPWSRSADFFLTNIKRGPTKELLNALFMECATNEELLMRLRRIDRRMVHADWDPNGRIWVPYKLSLTEVPELVDGKIRTTFKHIDDNQFQQIRPLLLNVAEKALTDFYKDTTK